MQIERMEILGINVRSLEAAMRVFGEILEVDFRAFRFGEDVAVRSLPTETSDARTVSFAGTRIAVDGRGFLQLIETAPPTEVEGPRNIHFKVPDLDAAIAELRGKGVRVVADTIVGDLREAILHPDDLHGLRICLVQYEGPSMLAALARRRGGEAAGGGDRP